MKNNFDNALQNKLKEVFLFTINFLTQNNLKYWTCGGTTLGSIRHGDIIPWDDDIDIYMPRKDYEQLLKIRHRLPNGYKMIALGDEGYYCPFGKIIDTNTTLWEVEEIPFVMGVFVDIFPLDYLDLEPRKISAIQKKAEFLTTIFQCSFEKQPLSHLFSLLIHFHLRFFCYYLIAWLLRGRIIHIFQNFLGKYKGNKGKYCVCLTQWAGKVFDSEWFDGSETGDFGSIKVNNPKSYDSYLRLLYGDYLRLPPIEKRISHHNQHYVNLKEGLTLDIIRERLDRGENFVY